MDWSLVSVGQQGAEYLHSAFEGGLSLAQEVLRSVDISEGACVSLVPGGARDDLVDDFARGGLGPTGVAVAGLATVVEERQTVGGGVFIAENAMAKPSDPTSPEDPAARFSFGEEVYEYSRAVEASVGRLEALIQHADAGYSMNAVLSTSDVARELPEHLGSIDSERLRRLAAGAVMLVARAYDGEGFVLWQR